MTFTSLVSAMTAQGDMEGASKWLSEMQKEGVQADLATFTPLINTAADKRRREDGGALDGRTEEAWAEAKRGDIHMLAWSCSETRRRGGGQALVGGDERRSGVKPNVVTFSALVDAAVKRRDKEKVKIWVDAMEAAELQPHERAIDSEKGRQTRY